MEFLTVTNTGNVGIGTPIPNSNVLLHLEANNKGFLLPRVVLTAYTSPSPLASAPPAGTMVYNRPISSLPAGLYYWDGTRWVRLIASPTGTVIVFGSEGPTSYILDAKWPGNWECTGAQITLPPGKWLVNVTEILRVAYNGAEVNAPCHIWVRTTLADGACTTGSVSTTSVFSSDIVGAVYMSGSIYANGLYDVLTGSILIHNTTGSNKTYSIWGNIELGPDCTGTWDANDGLIDFLAPHWAETQIYGIMVNY